METPSSPFSISVIILTQVYACYNVMHCIWCGVVQMNTVPASSDLICLDFHYIMEGQWAINTLVMLCITCCANMPPWSVSATGYKPNCVTPSILPSLVAVAIVDVCTLVIDVFLYKPTQSPSLPCLKTACCTYAKSLSGLVHY